MSATRQEPAVLTQDEVNEFEALTRFARCLARMQADLVEELTHITGEKGDEFGDLTMTVAWDVVHNDTDLNVVLRLCNLTLPGGVVQP